jgi:hypothetical protein
MPEICRFFGIIVRMYAEPEAPHHYPHFHVYYQDDVAVYGIDPIQLLEGSLPTKQRRLVEGWAELHQEQILEDWKLLQAGHPPLPVAPLQWEEKIMKHAIYSVTSCEIVGPYTLKLEFNDKTEQTIDFAPILKGELLSALRDLTLFNRVRLDPEVRTIVWPNGADFDPATLHNWHDYAAEITAWSLGLDSNVQTRSVAESREPYPHKTG